MKEKKPFKFATCDATSAALRFHFSSIHENRKHGCTKCDALITRKGHLKKHIKIIHEDNKALRCNTSDDYFTRKKLEKIPT
jgi:hypothetical protein